MAGVKPASEVKIRLVLRTGATVFGLSALLLLITPAFFNSLLGLVSTEPLEWSMRMIGITLLALAGNMFSVASRGSTDSVLLSGKVMAFAAAALGILTLLIPAQLNWFSVTYAIIGFGFSAAYLWALKK